jgi:hypothetical protein
VPALSASSVASRGVSPDEARLARGQVGHLGCTRGAERGNHQGAPCPLSAMESSNNKPIRRGDESHGCGRLAWIEQRPAVARRHQSVDVASIAATDGRIVLVGDGPDAVSRPRCHGRLGIGLRQLVQLGLRASVIVLRDSLWIRRIVTWVSSVFLRCARIERGANSGGGFGWRHSVTTIAKGGRTCGTTA